MKNSLMVKNGDVKPPSLSGLAFACVAATLPLLQGHGLSPETSAAVMLLDFALPLLVEPRVQKTVKDTTIEIEEDELNKLRLQHLLDRMEQVLVPLYHFSLTNLCAHFSVIVFLLSMCFLSGNLRVRHSGPGFH